jgi:3-methylcrotonyl-CoA carboxylase alpha subunit
MTQFTSILVANRGEIACRVIRTAKAQGYRTVAVYSEADAQAPHVQMADEAVCIGPSPVNESYLVQDKILGAAKTSGAEAIHPGYGFLSENADFARACEAAGLTFIGPSPDAIHLMGNKAEAKRRMIQAGVPCVPGYEGEDQADAALLSEGAKIELPLMVKAAAGGGGRGMRLVHERSELANAIKLARAEAESAFGSGQLILEKAIIRPRHVEVQVFGDNHGNIVHLGERDCSVQRRHQKVVEEAPCPIMTEQLREEMGAAAVAAAQSIDYCGAGTVEFLLDEDGTFYFMEMNTRLQVEHPVTEMITGQDLVEWQLLVASGEPLPLTQEEVRINGHAFEARIYAEDPDNDFLPVTGNLAFLQPPEESTHVRVDTGVRQGDEVSVFYDPMIAKLIVWDESRERALQRLASALAEYRIGGTVTNLDFLYNLATSRPFVEAELDTGFIEKHSELIFHERHQDLERELPLAALALLLHKQQGSAPASSVDPWSPWHSSNAWRLNEPHTHRLTLHCHQQDHEIAVEQRGSLYIVQAAERETQLQGELVGDILHLEVEGHRQRGTLAPTHDGFTLYLPEGACHFHEVLPDTGEADAASAGAGLTAPMNGTIVALLAEVGSVVEADTPLLVMEAMKMEHTIRAPATGKVAAFFYQPGDLVDGGAELLDFTADEE